MKLALAIVSLFPGGGLQRDCMAIARLLDAQGHDVTIFTSRLEGGVGDDLQVEVLPVLAFTNHGRNIAFSRAIARRCAGQFDRIVGFDKLEGLDVLYCADPPVAPRYQSRLSRILPRGRKLLLLERACFARESRTKLLLLSQPQVDAYRASWDTQAERIALLPPTINAQRRKPQLRTDGTRKWMREEMAVGANGWLWLAVGSQLRVKGIDRTLEALELFSDARLAIAGIGPSSKAARQFAAHGAQAWRGGSRPVAGRSRGHSGIDGCRRSPGASGPHRDDRHGDSRSDRQRPAGDRQRGLRLRGAYREGGSGLGSGRTVRARPLRGKASRGDGRAASGALERKRQTLRGNGGHLSRAATRGCADRGASESLYDRRRPCSFVGRD